MTTFFTIPTLNICSFRKHFPEKSSWLVHRVLRDLSRLSDGFANQSFCRSDISTVQLKSNWKVGKRLLASDSKAVCNSRPVLSKALLIFFNGWYGNWLIWKELSLKETLNDVMLHSGNCSEILMALRINHFVQLVG